MNRNDLGETILKLFFQVDYKQYLQSTAWAHKRQNALTRAYNRCQVCNSQDRLEVHHRTYERLGFEKNEDLTVLCHKCHTAFHKGGRMPTRTTPKRKTRTRRRL
jgi:5-methylcytosine-specific restriction endonuclease McrA